MSKKGNISQIMGAVVDVNFPSSELPEIYNALEIDRGKDGKLSGSWSAYHLKTTLNWGLTAALGAILLGFMLIFYWLYNKIVGIDNIKLG